MIFLPGPAWMRIRQSVLDNLFSRLGKVPDAATQNDWYMALSYTVRDRMMQRWIETLQNFTEDVTVVACLSSEFLTGPQLGSNLVNLGIHDQVSQAVKELGLDLARLMEQEEEPGLGNGEPRQTCSVLYGFTCNSRDSCNRIRGAL